MLQPAASTAHPATDPPHAAPSEPAAATSPLEAATAVALPNDASTVVLTARKRGRPSKAEQALRRQVPDAQTATATAVEAAGPSTAAIASTTDATKPTAAKGGGKASKSGNPGAKAASSKAAGAKGRKQLTAAAAAHKADKEPAKAEPKRVLSKTQVRLCILAQHMSAVPVSSMSTDLHSRPLISFWIVYQPESSPSIGAQSMQSINI